MSACVMVYEVEPFFVDFFFADFFFADFFFADFFFAGFFSAAVKFGFPNSGWSKFSYASLRAAWPRLDA